MTMARLRSIMCQSDRYFLVSCLSLLLDTLISWWLCGYALSSWKMLRVSFATLEGSSGGEHFRGIFVFSRMADHHYTSNLADVAQSSRETESYLINLRMF